MLSAPPPNLTCCCPRVTSSRVLGRLAGRARGPVVLGRGLHPESSCGTGPLGSASRRGWGLDDRRTEGVWSAQAALRQNHR